MPRTFVVRIDLARLQANLSAQVRRPLAESEVLDWLRDAGFTRVSSDHWLVAEPDLGHLLPAEVLGVPIVQEETEPSLGRDL